MRQLPLLVNDDRVIPLAIDPNHPVVRLAKQIDCVQFTNARGRGQRDQEQDQRQTSRVHEELKKTSPIFEDQRSTIKSGRQNVRAIKRSTSGCWRFTWQYFKKCQWQSQECSRTHERSVYDNVTAFFGNRFYRAIRESYQNKTNMD